MADSRSYVGASVQRVDACAKVTGQALYPGDLVRPGMLHMKILFAGRPHARILSLDATRARALPGVTAVLTAADVPINAYGLAFDDQPVLCDDVVLCEGDQVALVLAESAEIAERARGMIEVVYEDLPPLCDPRQAMLPAAAVLHRGRADNVLDHIRIRKGDAAAALAAADVVIEGHYYVPMQEHAYLQPEAGLAYMDGDVVVVETAGQWAHHDQRQIAAALDLPLERVRVIYRAIGGAFGGREDVSVQIVLALAAWRTGRPVKLVWSRAESIRGHGKRHQMYLDATWGADRDGRLVAADVDVIADAGAYAYTTTMVLGHTAMNVTGPYDIPHVRVDAYAVYTNNVPAGAFRGFGSPQGVFAAELQIERLAEALGIDPITLRERNLLAPGGELSVGTPVPDSIDMRRLLVECARRAGWRQGPAGWERPSVPPGHGSGLAVGFKNIGFSFGYPEESSVAIELSGGAEIEEAVVRFGGAECGQGLHTVITQMAAEALGVPIERVRLIGADTALSPEAGSASASRLTLMGGNAILGAAAEARARWADEERPVRVTHTYHAPATTAFDPATGHSVPHVVFSPVAQAVEVALDVETGQIEVPRVVTVVDVGKAINPRLVEGQVEGAVAQAFGYAVLENFVSREGRILTPSLSTYLVPTVLDVPREVETCVVEHPDPIGPWGARGVGETPLIALAPAIVSAVHEVTGTWLDRLPLTPCAVSGALRRPAT